MKHIRALLLLCASLTAPLAMAEPVKADSSRPSQITTERLTSPPACQEVPTELAAIPKQAPADLAGAALPESTPSAPQEV